jgi:spore germination protein KB
MIENGKISPLQFGIVVFMFSLGSAALLMPSIVVSIAKQDAWISVLSTILVDVLFISLWNRLSKKYPDETIVQFSERILGKLLGKLVGIMYVCFFLYLSALVLRNVGGFITTNVLRQTPELFVQIIFMLTIIYGSYLGLEVISRTSEVLFPWVIIVFLFTTALLLNHIDLSKLLPVMPDGWQIPLKGIYPLLGFPISELVIVLFIFPFVDRPKKIKKYSTLFSIMTALFGTLIVMMSISVLGVDVTARSPYAPFDLAKEIRVGKFFERVEVLVGFIWIMTIFVKLSFSFYAANLASAQLFNLKSYRVTILPYGLFVTALSMIVFRNPAEFSLFTAGAYPFYGLIHGFFIPVLLLLVVQIREIIEKKFK